MSERISRRTLVKRGLIAGGALAGGGAVAAGLLGSEQTPRRRASVPGGRQAAPNILVIVVDQLRTPQWFQRGGRASHLMPNLAELRRGAVCFDRHYTASNDCSPSRGVLLTGLYSHQTGCLLTGGSTLAPSFPTWGTMLRDEGYETWWYGKWHLTHHDNRWTYARDHGALERYGFAGGTYPSPDGGPGQGWRVDPRIVDQFEAWYRRAPTGRPWCTTVSLVNPHDIAWWFRWSERVKAEATAARIVGALPPNFETPAQMIARGKPRLQRSLQDTAQVSFGRVPYHSSAVLESWLPFMNLYLKLGHRVDEQIGRVMRTLLSRPHIAANTVVVFTSDHGEYGASHGMRGKGASAYEEALRIPLIVKDLREEITSAETRLRTGLTSSADVAPLLLSIATGSQAWRDDSHYAHLAARHDLFGMLSDPTAAGRPYVLHATDEIVTEFAIKLYAADAPLHVTAIRTPTAKYATYSHWKRGTNEPVPASRERELYEYATRAGRMEIDNRVGHGPQQESLHAQLREAIRDELRAPLPRRLHAAQADGYNDYLTSARAKVIEAARHRRKIEETRPAPRAVEQLGSQ